MRLSRAYLISIAVMLAAFSLSLSALGGPINVLLSVDQTVVCEGTTVSVTLTASDPDPILEPDPCMGYTFFYLDP